MIPVMKRPKAAAIYARFSASQSWQPREWDLAKTSFPLALVPDPVVGCRWVRPLLETYNTMSIHKYFKLVFEKHETFTAV